MPAFYGGGVIHSIVTTTNGLERQHEELKHNYLTDSSNGSLTDLVSAVVTQFVPQSKHRYKHLDV